MAHAECSHLATILAIRATMENQHLPNNPWLWDYLATLPPLANIDAVLDGHYSIIAFWGLVLLTAVAGEQLWRLLREKRRLSADFATNVSVFFIGIVFKGLVTRAFMLFMLIYCYSLSPWKLEISPMLIVATWLASDFSYYWFHRLGHESRLFWADHQQHHSSTELDFSTNLRRPFLDETYKWFPAAGFCLLGVDPILMFIVFKATAAWQVWCHNDRIGRLGWLEPVFNTPSNHRVHHSRNPVYIDKNYGGFLMIWDRLFGTYQAELANTPAEFGVNKPINTRNPFKVIGIEYQRLFEAVAATPGHVNKLKKLFYRPGWEAPDQQQKNRA